MLKRIVEIPQLQSGGKSSLPTVDNKEADEELCHVHGSHGLSMEHRHYNTLRRHNSLLEAAQM
jgi:hypothetical protein